MAKKLVLENFSLWHGLICIEYLLLLIYSGGGAVSGTFNWVVILEKGIAPLSQTQIFSNLQPDDLNLWNFMLRLFDLTELTVWNM